MNLVKKDILELQKEFIEKPELKEQLDFLKKGGASGMSGVVLVDAFLKGIRDLGYKDTAYALNFFAILIWSFAINGLAIEVPNK